MKPWGLTCSALAQISLLRIADTKWWPTLKFRFGAFLGEY
jgi:hypothetical protein